MNSNTLIDTIISAGWIIPGEPIGKVLEGFSIAINHGKIVDILDTDKCLNKYTATHVHDLPQHILFPGLINMHGHSAMSLMRGIADDTPLKAWLEDHIWPTEAQFVSEDFVTDGTRLAIAEMLRSGTTFVNDMYFFPNKTAEVVHETGFQACVGLLVIDFPTAWAANADEYFEKALSLADKYKNHPRIMTAFAPHAPYTVCDDSLKRIATIAQELDLLIHIHLHETQSEVDDSLSEHKVRPLERLDNLGLLGPRFQAVHMTALSESDIKTCKKNKVSIIHCPESNLKLGSGICPVSSLLQKNVNVALGTDGAASNNDLDMLGEMRTAALLAKGSTQDPTNLSAASALHMATLAGAKSLGLEHSKGSLKKHKDADIVAIKVSDIESEPMYNPISHLVYSANRSQVTDVWVQGKHLLNQRKLTTIDEKQVIANAKSWREKINSKCTIKP
jgi:5-methylthioadenosine/S-adenosylhomocysteine deaminase